MSVSLGPAAQGGKRPVDAELNLVPFIDLLVCCICFLLLTAVWVELCAVRTRTGGGWGGQAEERPRVSVLVGSEGYTLNLGTERRELPRRGSSYDDLGLRRELRALRAQGERPLSVAAEDGVPYRQVIRAVDLAHGAAFSEISVTDSRGLF